MKLISAKFENFRLLQNVEMNFSTDEFKKLTVIRAENGTGKTTAMSGLLWGLYGTKVVPEKLYPLSLAESGNAEIPISVTIDFETEEVVSSGGKTLVNQKVYRLVRSCIEKVLDGGKKYERYQDEVNLFELTDEGFKPKIKSEIDTIIQRSLPVELKDIYFTDGDKALTFIESSATTTEKRKRVQSAIESLLSLKNLESAIKNLKSVGLSYARKIDKSDYGKKLYELEAEIESKDSWIVSGESELSDLIAERSKVDQDIASTNKRIEEQLTLGNREELCREIGRIKSNISKNRTVKENSIKSLCTLLNHRDVTASLIHQRLGRAREVLKEKKARDNFPKQFIPVLKDVLGREKCLCGSDLSDRTEEGRAKISFINNAVEGCKEVDKLNGLASDLYFASDKYLPAEGGEWQESYSSFSSTYFTSDSVIRDEGSQLKRKGEIVDSLNDDVLQALREKSKTLESKLNDIKSRIILTQDEVTRFKEARELLRKQADLCASKVSKKNTAGGKHELSKILLGIYESVFERIKTEELKKVSHEMNVIFLSMIAADTGLDPKGMIRSSELTPEYDIKVYGPAGQPLNPDTELNGASRRAISLSFILALTKVSKVTAANIIDTPLGMTSGMVKASILKNLVQQGSQIILFLTFDEIKGIEDLLDEFVGSAMTMTFSGHYPVMLQNKPENDGETVICDCNHRQCCEFCVRHDQANMMVRSI